VEDLEDKSIAKRLGFAHRGLGLVLGVVAEVVDVDVALGLRREIEVRVGDFEGVVDTQRSSNKSLIATCLL